MEEMENEIMQMVIVALASAPIVSGITNKIKENTGIEKIEVILTAILVGVALFGAVAYLRDYPLVESVLMGILSGFASVGAFESVKQTKGE
ncbi:hypothetical protein LZ578_08570 [Jeotgalibaca sp. MA1X17-3]|uniref:hypothetical protein n=1 Tax=Jeotgalibaca sp. MA1X17-3 TaxID=2908211 RepID=UPI001F1A9DF5|nr:hypothetical protein [Jeotgalibaca sp. MA1X17-3]UJF15052.1 hypothetical protein LZ578_08570 [Jeotgalibaca sp. MA1X17-3]